MIYYPKIYGTCIGANRAINIAYKLKEEFKDKHIVIFKEILHNEYVIDELKNDGIDIINDLNELKKDDILVIRAHGEPKETYEYLNKNNITYYDATCKKVERIHELVEEKYNDNYKIIIVGKKNHPEVIGTNGWCNNEAIIVENKSDYTFNPRDYYYVVSQTTISQNKVDELTDYLAKNHYYYSLDNTICNYQKQIQTSAVELANNVDLMIVVGGKSSSNTKELYNVCNKICKSYFFNDINEVFNFLKTSKFKKNIKIGITGGASTSKKQISEIANLIEFFSYYNNRKKDIEKEIIKFNKSLIQNDNTIVNDLINKFINMNSDGKCIRGIMIDLGYKLNKNDDYSLKLSAAYETFETSILIHDDIIDNSDLRRGKKTISKEYKDEYDIKDNTHNNLALCAGDLGFYLINNYIINNYKNDKKLNKLLNEYNNIVINTIKGEILDVFLPFIEKNDKKHILNENDILEIYRLKTSLYTIVGPFILGMILGNSKQKDINLFKEILLPLGIAFQIKDDILGIFSNNKVLGKPVVSDIEEFKQTILYSYIKLNNKKYYDELIKYYGKKINKHELLEVQNIIKESGSLEYANKLMNKMFTEVKNNISKISIKKDIKNILLGFISYLELRNK